MKKEKNDKDQIEIEKRLNNIKRFYEKTGEIIDNLPNAVSDAVKSKLKDSILKNEDLKNFMQSIDDNRPPRFLLIGRTGVGKSSLINALCGAYVAQVSDTVSCTRKTETYKCVMGDRTLMEILDTRGIAESSPGRNNEAENQLIKEITRFSPDAAIFMLNCTHRDDVDSDAEFLKRVDKVYSKKYKNPLPIITVVNKCDEMAPARLKDPDEYTEAKKKKIDQQVQSYKAIIEGTGLKIAGIVPVSSLVEWETADGEPVDVEDIEKLSRSEREHLKIAFDGRWGIDRLYDLLEQSILDLNAQMGLRMAAKLDVIIKRLAEHLINIFSEIAAAVALTPIPIADIYILLPLQGILVCMIAYLYGRDLTMDTALEFILNLGGVTAAGFTFRLIAQESSKLLNGIIPAAGSVISSTIASSGTKAIGEAALAYYTEGESLEASKKKFEDVKEDFKKIRKNRH